MEIQEITLHTRNLQETLFFYNRILSIEILDENLQTVRFAAGKSILTFIERELPERPVYHFAFNIPENKMEEAIQWSKGKFELLPVTEDGVIADFSLWNAHSIYFKDNNGNVLEFIARHDLKNSTAERFSAALIECISEIGVVAENVKALTDHFSAQYGLPIFSKQPRLENFAALGDDHGLVIIVGNNRSWFPTSVPSETHPTTIRLKEGARMITFIPPLERQD